MHPQTLRQTLALSLLALIIAVPASASGRRRAVTHPTAGGKITATKITGTVVDNVTGQPVISARVEGGGDSDLTDSKGAFELRNLEAYGVLAIEVSRSGYVGKKVNLTAGGEQTLNFRLDPTATVRVRKTDNTTVDLDFESLQFGYALTFGGYVSAEFEDFCKPDGTPVAYSRDQIKRIVGPATEVNYAPCCPNGTTMKINVELETGEKSDLYFVDACNGYLRIDVIGREHTTGKFQYIQFTQIAEVILP